MRHPVASAINRMTFCTSTKPGPRHPPRRGVVERYN